MYEIPVQTVKQCHRCSIQLFSDGEYKGSEEAKLMQSGDVESNPGPHVSKGAYNVPAELQMLRREKETSTDPIATSGAGMWEAEVHPSYTRSKVQLSGDVELNPEPTPFMFEPDNNYASKADTGVEEVTAPTEFLEFGE